MKSYKVGDRVSVFCEAQYPGEDDVKYNGTVIEDSPKSSSSVTIQIDDNCLDIDQDSTCTFDKSMVSSAEMY